MMNKKLIAVAIATALATPLAAQAGVEVYGQARMSIDFSSNDDGDNGTCVDPNTTPATECSDSAISVSSNRSRLGFKGDEDLGNGLTAMWQIEQGVDLDTGSAFTENRNTYVGLSGNFGQVRLGHHDTPNKMVSAPLDIFADTRADFNALSLESAGDLRSDNVIAYISPDMSGFTVLAAYIPSYSNDTLAQTQEENDQNAISLAGSYTNGPLYVGAAYESMASYMNEEDLVDMKLVGSWDFGQGTKVGAMFETTTMDNVGGPGIDLDRTLWYLNVAHTVGETTFKAAYGMADDLCDDVACDKTGADHISIGAFHNLSKNTEVYALYTMLGNDDDSEYHLKGVDSGEDAGLMQDASSFSFGVNHKFSSK